MLRLSKGLREFREVGFRLFRVKRFQGSGVRVGGFTEKPAREKVLAIVSSKERAVPSSVMLPASHSVSSTSAICQSAWSASQSATHPVSKSVEKPASQPASSLGGVRGFRGPNILVGGMTKFRPHQAPKSIVWRQADIR